MSSIGYRPEIDGLRAVSVIGVLLFHAGLGVSGGYVGVDVFFVISGFLITSIVLAELERGTFTLRNFWVRRVRRILPAGGVVLAASLVAGLFVLEPAALRDLAGSAASQAVFGANLWFWATTDYFAEAAEFKPLLHTWSLAVEEQFYMVLPVVLLLAQRSRRALLAVLIATALASLGLSLYATERHAAAAFYLLPTRAWELLAGALLACFQARLSLGRAQSELLSALGLAAILAGMASFDASTPFPGSAALAPVLGAVAVILGCQGGPTLVGRLLSLRPVVFVGLSSYSLYLWHWPLFAFARHLFIDLGLGLRLALVLVSFLLAIASWRFVETPFRTGARLRSPRGALRFGLATSGALAAASLALHAAGGWPGRFDERVRTLAEDIVWNGPPELVEGATPNPLGEAEGSDAPPDLLVWGDSHARMLAAHLDEALRARGLRGELYLTNGVVPVPGLWRPSWSPAKRARVLARNEAIVASLVERRVPHVLLVSRWSNNVAGRNANDVAAGHRRTDSLVTDEPGRAESEATPDAAAASLARGLDALIDRLSAAGTKVWVLAQVPETWSPSTARDRYLLARFPRWNELARATTDAAAHALRTAPFEQALAALRTDGLRLVDPVEQAGIFGPDGGGHLVAYDQRAYYRDDNHLTRAGVARYAAPALAVVLDAVAQGSANATATEERFGARPVPASSHGAARR